MPTKKKAPPTAAEVLSALRARAPNVTIAEIADKLGIPRQRAYTLLSRSTRREKAKAVQAAKPKPPPKGSVELERTGSRTYAARSSGDVDFRAVLGSSPKPGPTSAELDELKRLRVESRQLAERSHDLSHVVLGAAENLYTRDELAELRRGQPAELTRLRAENRRLRALLDVALADLGFADQSARLAAE